jgi:hypothetical protein
MAGLTAIKRKGFAGGGKDSSTISSENFSARSYSPSEKASQAKTQATNQRISNSD